MLAHRFLSRMSLRTTLRSSIPCVARTRTLVPKFSVPEPLGLASLQPFRPCSSSNRGPKDPSPSSSFKGAIVRAIDVLFRKPIREVVPLPDNILGTLFALALWWLRVVAAVTLFFLLLDFAFQSVALSLVMLALILKSITKVLSAIGRLSEDE